MPIGMSSDDRNYSLSRLDELKGIVDLLSQGVSVTHALIERLHLENLYKDLSDEFVLNPDEVINMILFFQIKINFMRIPGELLQKVFDHTTASNSCVMKWWGVIIVTNEACTGSLHAMRFFQDNNWNSLMRNIVRDRLQGCNGSKIQEEFVDKWTRSEVDYLRIWAESINPQHYDRI